MVTDHLYNIGPSDDPMSRFYGEVDETTAYVNCQYDVLINGSTLFNKRDRGTVLSTTEHDRSIDCPSAYTLKITIRFNIHIG